MKPEEKAYKFLREDICRVRPEYEKKQVLVCPICMREISKEAFLEHGLEPIIPKVHSAMSRGRRSGYTVLCHEERKIEGDGSVSEDGCSGYKKRMYDSVAKNFLPEDGSVPTMLSIRQKISITIMAYLGAFQQFGYGSVFWDELDEIRKQFDFPKKKITKWIDNSVCMPMNDPFYLMGSTKDQPFAVGGSVQDGHPLHMVFGKCFTLLPVGLGELVASGIKMLNLDERMRR